MIRYCIYERIICDLLFVFLKTAGSNGIREKCCVVGVLRLRQEGRLGCKLSSWPHPRVSVITIPLNHSLSFFVLSLSFFFFSLMVTFFIFFALRESNVLFWLLWLFNCFTQLGWMGDWCVSTTFRCRNEYIIQYNHFQKHYDFVWCLQLSYELVLAKENLQLLIIFIDINIYITEELTLFGQ